jgi:hypothetical protein
VREWGSGGSDQWSNVRQAEIKKRLAPQNGTFGLEHSPQAIALSSFVDAFEKYHITIS